MSDPTATAATAGQRQVDPCNQEGEGAHMNATEEAQQELVELPLPRESFDGMIVIASVWLDDDRHVALVLTLASSNPFYRLREVVWRNGEWRTVFFDDYPNIVPAVDAYKDAGGDY